MTDTLEQPQTNRILWWVYGETGGRIGPFSSRSEARDKVIERGHGNVVLQVDDFMVLANKEY